MRVEARLTGYPRSGPEHDLEPLLERRRAGQMTLGEFNARISDLRCAHVEEQREVLDSAIDDFFLYDPVVEAALMFGIVPEGLARTLVTDPFAALSELGRRTAEPGGWAVRKWFETDREYVVPEISAPVGAFRSLPWRQPTHEEDVTWPVLGPYSLLKLSTLAEGGDPQQTAADLGSALWRWCRRQPPIQFQLQVDEPCLGLTMTDADRGLFEAAYADASDLPLPPAIVSVQLGETSDDTIALLGERGFSVQIPLSRLGSVDAVAWESQREYAISVMDGSSPRADSFDAVADAFANVEVGDRQVWIVPSTSLAFLPHSVEPGPDAAPGRLWSARDKARELRRWADALRGGEPPKAPSSLVTP